MRSTGDVPAATDWRLLVLGWAILASAVTLGTFPFLRLRQERIFVSVFALTLCAASIPMSLVCRALWRRRDSLGRAIPVTLTAAYILGFCCSAAATVASAPFGWQSALGGALTAWFALSAWSAAYFGIQHSHASEAAHALARDAELRALRYQINPHFLFNTLNTVSSLVAEGRSDAATHMLARLGDFFRSTLIGDSNDVLLADEVALAEQYLDIERIRLGSRLTLELDVAPAALPAKMPHLLLQPLVENAIRHGIAPLAAGGRIALHVRRAASDVLITVRNDCPLASSRSSGIGLSNTAARLEQAYGRNHTFEVRPSEGTYVVSLRFPFR
jgi:two-component system sensor histidine kinase AlgZ